MEEAVEDQGGLPAGVGVKVLRVGAEAGVGPGPGPEGRGVDLLGTLQFVALDVVLAPGPSLDQGEGVDRETDLDPHLRPSPSQDHVHRARRILLTERGSIE